MKQVSLFLITLNALFISCSTPSRDSAFIDNLMSRMTLEEKIGQLNLPSGGDIQTGTVFGAELDSLILEGKIGGFFNVKGVDEISRLQHLAVERGPHGIPLLVGADVIHGYETIFPIPLALSCSWDTTAIERMAQISAMEIFQKELTDVEDAYKEVTGEEMTKFYRPPQGKYSESNLKNAQQLGYQTFFWSLAYVDWYENDQPTKEEAFDKLIGRIHPGAIVLLHNTSRTNAEILDELLGKWEEMGYQIRALAELSAQASAK